MLGSARNCSPGNLCGLVSVIAFLTCVWDLDKSIQSTKCSEMLGTVEIVEMVGPKASRTKSA